MFSNQGGIKSALTGKMASKVTRRVDNVIEAVSLSLFCLSPQGRWILD